MKVLLIQPPIRDFYQTTIRTQPIGLAYLAASLVQHGHEAAILDCQTGQRRAIPVPPELSHLRQFYPFGDRSPFKLYTGYYHFGMAWDEIRRSIEASEADVFGISSAFTPYHGEALEIARIVKEWDRRKVVVMGGAHVSGDPDGVLQSPFVDYVVLGEGEVRFPRLLEALERGTIEHFEEIDGMGYRKDGRVRIIPIQTFIEDLDGLPYPSRELLDPERYRFGKKRSTMLITSRGCPHRCAYCSAHLVMGSTFRKRSPNAVLREMLECHRRYDIRLFDIEDDNFTFDRARAKQLMKLILETFGERRLELTAMNGVSYASLDKELLDLMGRAGFRSIGLSLVSADASIREGMARPGSPSSFDEILKEAEMAGLDATVYAILGMPGQTIEEMVDTLVLLMGRRVLIGPSIYYPTPGTPLFNACKRRGLLPHPSSLWRSSAFPVETSEFDRLDLVTLFRLARVLNTIKGRMVIDDLEEGLTVGQLDQVLRDRKAGKKVEAKVEGEEDRSPECRARRNRGVSCEDLILTLLCERSFVSLRRGGDGKMTAVKERSSRRVLDCFFEKARRRPILGTRSARGAPPGTPGRP